MKTAYRIENGKVVAGAADPAPIVVYGAPTEAEKREILASLGIDTFTLESALDPDESPRAEFAASGLSVFWKAPSSATARDQVRFGVRSVALFLRGDALTLVQFDDVPTLVGKEFDGSRTGRDVMLRFMLSAIHHFTGHLKVIKMLTADLQEKLNKSSANEYLLQMFALSESLIYYQDALEACQSVLQILRKNAEKVGFIPAEVELLDDVIIEQAQCCRQTMIYSSVLGGLMDSRGNIINNNMNVMLKKLTLLNTVFLPLNLVAGIGGMSEYTMMTEKLGWPLSYTLFMIVLAILGWGTWTIIVWFVDKPEQGRTIRRKK